MVFKTKHGKRKEKPNRLKSNPVISFHSKLHPETLGYIKKLAGTKQKTPFINRAIEREYFFVTNKRQFLRQMIQEDYALCRYLLRKIGNEGKNYLVKQQ